MAEQSTIRPTVAGHGATRLPSVIVDSYNVELKDDEGFLGDRASKGAFRTIIENWRKALRKVGDDPFGDEPSEQISRKKLDAVLTEGSPEAAGVLQGALEDFSQELALVIRRFLKLKAWRDTARIAVGGGFRGSRVGELAIGRAAVILKAEKIDIDLDPIRHDPDEAGLIGAAHLAPPWMFEGHDAILAVDIGGTNIRAGVVELAQKKAPDLSKAFVWKFELWRHAEEKNLKREDAVGELIRMLKDLIARAAKEGLHLAPFIGIGCPGVIEADGTIARGAQNLPGNWESSRFNLPLMLHEEIPTIGKHETMVLMHNDAVVQGLSQTPFMADVRHWGALTIGTGLGNARFTTRALAEKD
ncbi:MAG: ROK family protein [Xanthobacteraceae bacterium]